MTLPNHASENSVTISLAELARIEEERVQREESERARLRAERAQKAREAEEVRRAEEAAKLAAEEQARSRRARDELIEKARLEAREQAAADVARIEAEAKVKLAADNAVRAHELNQLRVRRETGRRRREYVLGAALALFACIGGVTKYSAGQRLDELERATVELREREHARAGERDDARSTELAALDRRHAALLARSAAEGAEGARKTAEEARQAIGERAPGHERLRRFGDALDALENRIEALEKIEALDRRRDDLAAWAASSRRKDVAEELRRAAAAAKASGAAAEYEQALGQARAALTQRAGLRPNRPAGEPGPAVGRCHEGDPSCGIDGRPIF
jgi:hypothetical protein